MKTQVDDRDDGDSVLRWMDDRDDNDTDDGSRNVCLLCFTHRCTSSNVLSVDERLFP